MKLKAVPQGRCRRKKAAAALAGRVTVYQPFVRTGVWLVTAVHTAPGECEDVVSSTYPRGNACHLT